MQYNWPCSYLLWQKSKQFDCNLFCWQKLTDWLHSGWEMLREILKTCLWHKSYLQWRKSNTTQFTSCWHHSRWLGSCSPKPLSQISHYFTTKKVWELKNSTVHKDYETLVNEKCTELFSKEKPVSVTDAWNKVKTCLLNGVDQVGGLTRGGRVQHAETWWWNDDVHQYIKEKQRQWKLKNGWFQGGLSGC